MFIIYCINNHHIGVRGFLLGIGSNALFLLDFGVHGFTIISATFPKKEQIMVYIKRKSESAEWPEQKRFLEFMETYDLKCRHIAVLLGQTVDSIYKYRRGTRRMSDTLFFELKEKFKVYLFNQIEKLGEL